MRVVLTEESQEGFLALPTDIKARVRKILKRLESWPEVSGAKALRGDLSGNYRVRTGDYRVQFVPGRDELVVVAIGHREGFYGE